MEGISAEEALQYIRRAEAQIKEVFSPEVNRVGEIGFQHLYLFGIARRALSQSRAFVHMISDRNSLVAASLLRLQLDTVLRLYAIYWVNDAESFAKRVFEGEQIDRLKAADGTAMTDKYLRDRLLPRNPWVSDVYKSTSGFVHFSSRHMNATLASRGNGRAAVFIGPQDFEKDLSYYGELLRAFMHLNMMIPVACEDWFQRIRKENKPMTLGILNSEGLGASR